MFPMFRTTRSKPSRSSPQVAPEERVYAIGDIHGRSDLLVALLKKINADALSFTDARLPRIVFLGDYIDRGDDTARVLNMLEHLAAGDRHRINFLLGNHEQALLEFLEDPDQGSLWLRYGGEQTLGSYGIALRTTTPDTIQLYAIRDQLRHALGSKVAFLEALRPYAQSGDVIFSHAGINPTAQNFLQDHEAMIWGHPEFCTEEPVRGRLIVHGHYDAPEVHRSSGRICVDTGAYYSGKLAAVRLDDSEAVLEVSALDLD